MRNMVLANIDRLAIAVVLVLLLLWSRRVDCMKYEMVRQIKRFKATHLHMMSSRVVCFCWGNLEDGYIIIISQFKVCRFFHTFRNYLGMQFASMRSI